MNAKAPPNRRHDLPEHNSFALAVAVLRERIHDLPKPDRDDLYNLLPDLLSGDEGAQRSAQRAIDEILSQPPSRVISSRVMDSDGSELDKWINYVGDHIKEERVKAGLTQTQLADKAGLPQSHISRLESKQHSPTAMTLEKIAKALNLPTSTFDPSAE